MKLGVNKEYSLQVFGVLDIDVEEYVKWLNGDIPSRDNLQEYIDEEFDLDGDIKISILTDGFEYDLDKDFTSFTGAAEYKLLLSKAEEIQYELENENTSME